MSNMNSEVENIKEQIISIVDGLLSANELLIEALSSCNIEQFQNAKSYMKNISKKTSDIDNNIIKVLALYSPEAKDLREVVSYFKITNELNRACSSSRSFIKGFSEICDTIDKDMITKYIIPMQKSTTKSIKSVKQMFDTTCDDDINELYNETVIEENKTDDLYELIENSQTNHTMLRILRKCAKIADRAMGIASLLLYAQKGGEIHQV